LEKGDSGGFEDLQGERIYGKRYNPEVMGGKPCIRGMRVTVGAIVGLVATGKTVDEVLADYPYLEREDILEALSYAAWWAEEREVPLASE
jgi:uncharacterized protein (DUF433 family)